MANKTFIPAFKAQVGDWNYYMCLMKYAEVNRQIQFAYQLGGNQDLGTMIQRGISERTTEIRDYLLTNEHRFLGALVVAAWGGHPEYIPLEMVDSEGVLAGVDREFGVLTFDGTHSFFALDGQHRLRAIKDAVAKDPSLGAEDIGVIIVPHFDDSEGHQRTRRLFTNINRNAKPTSVQENIALDEDDGFAILTRRLLDEHEFLGRQGVVQVFSRQGDEGLLKLATRNVTLNATAWTTIGVLYDLLSELRFGLDPTMTNRAKRATDEILDASYDILRARLDELLIGCGDLRARYEGAISARELRSPKGHEGDGHPFMRPVVQVQVVRALRHVVESELLDWPESLKRLSALEWKMSSPPWLSVFLPERGTMVAGKQFSDLLYDLLIVHLAPPTRAQIQRTLRTYREIKSSRYPVSEEQLAAHLPLSAE